MKVSMCEWIPGQIKNLPAWFKHGQEAEVTWAQIQELYDCGANVLLTHSGLLAVDTMRFQQR